MSSIPPICGSNANKMSRPSAMDRVIASILNISDHKRQFLRAQP